MMSLKEVEVSREMCKTVLLHGKPVDPNSPECAMLQSALYAAKVTLPKGSPRRVFIQDFAASLNRKHILPNENYDKFQRLGYEYMEV
jgi:hypothetical protein